MESALFFLVVIWIAGGLATWGIWFPVLMSILGLGGGTGFVTTVVKRERDEDTHKVGEDTLAGYAERNHLSYTPKPYDKNEYDHRHGGH